MSMIPQTLSDIVSALCKDYPRRAKAIAEGSVSPRVKMEYRYLNDRILCAALSLVGDQDTALLYIEELGGKVGYANSRADVSERIYKETKREIKRRILVALSLVDWSLEKIFPSADL